MAVQQSIADLPRAAKPKSEGCPPDAEPRFVHLLVEQWHAEDQAAGSKPRAFTDTRFRHSDAGACARAIALTALDVEASSPMDLTGTWNTRLGTLIHELWQSALSTRYPDALIEPKMRSVDGQGSGHADAFLVTTEKVTILFELKTIGGYGYKMAVGERGAAQGPKPEHRIQGALNARGLGADEVVIGYLSKEAISAAIAKRKGISELGRICSEWTFHRDEWEPLADAEEARVAGILALLDGGELAARKIPSDEVPPGAVIVDPSAGRWEVRKNGNVTDTGTFWACDYCKHQGICPAMPADRCSVDAIPVEFRPRHLKAVAS